MTASWRRGVRLAIDVGTVRIGVARSDPDGILASPVETVARGEGDLDRLLALIEEHEAIEVLVGLPVALSGRKTASTRDAQQVAAALAARAAVPIRQVDERLTTVTADRHLRAAGRTARTGRRVVDQVAAAIILEHALETERRTGRPAGNTVSGDATRDSEREGKHEW